ncbi:Receptor-like serine/threonine-protein kinase [Forsythia ovata]|uniref:Receptor-like serine/threonine-protein kinase n=1 Tax=Forsythia ovata TaxID=205694 RepID=A0ABD1S6V4_9LAMI
MRLDVRVVFTPSLPWLVQPFSAELMPWLTWDVDIKSLSSLNRDDLKKISGENFPEWISFPVFEQMALICFQHYYGNSWSSSEDSVKEAIAESSEMEEETAEIVGSKKKPILDWNIRYRIAPGVARAIAYLHEECLEWVLHCDIKTYS